MPVDTSTFLDDLPERIRDRVALLEGVLHISEDLLGDVDLSFLLSNLRCRGIVRHEFHKPSEFEEQYARFAARNAKADNEIFQMAIDLIVRAHREGASDIIIADNGSFTLVKFRRLGRMCEDSQIAADTGRKMIRVIFDTLGQSSNGPAFTALERLDARIVKRDYLPEGVHSVRIHTEPIECAQADNGTGTFMALRMLFDSTTASGTIGERLEVLGFREEQRLVVDDLTQRTGLALVSGPTGHGKSTALKHIMEGMAVQMPEKSFLSVEDPPEYPLKGVFQVQVNTNANAGENRASAYREAIAGAMRSDPDVMMIGEIRYPEAAMAAMEVALTGHAVWATVHANNAFGIVTRIETMLRSANVRDPLSMLCDPNVLSGLEYQRLVPKLCPHCKRPLYADGRPDPLVVQSLRRGVVQRLNRTMKNVEQTGVCVLGEGCDKCHGDGLMGQTVVAEVIAVNPEMLSLLRAGKMPDAIRYWKEELHGITYIQHARELIMAGELDPAIAESRLAVPLDFDKYNERRGDK